MVHILDAHGPEYAERVRSVFREYAESLRFQLCFQGFDHELATLPGEYAPPDGRLLLALDEQQVAGCAALRRFNAAACEMKRLYVRPAFRGLGLGRRLAAAIIDHARRGGYREMLLDTVPSMATAIALYERLGFEDVPPYRHNPIEGARYMRLVL